MTAHRLFDRATLDGARYPGIIGITGSLKPGKHADIVLARADGANTGPMTGSAFAPVYSMQAGNVDAVMVDGRIMDRPGRLVAADVTHLVSTACTSMAGISARAASHMHELPC